MTGLSTGSAFQPGDLLNNTYRIEEVLGRGGTSEVYKARSEISGRHVALKALRTDLSAQEDFLALMTREEAMRDIRHEAVVRYSENQRTPEGLVFLVMDFVDGPLLETKLRSGGLPTDTILVIAKRLLEGLRAAHTKNIVHRDLSPDNVILRGDNPEDAVIIDFGIAKDTNPGAETIVGNEFAGKYAYAAPEQLAGKTDARSDLYSLGAMLLAVYRGEAPDMGNNPMEVVQNKSLPLDTRDVPEELKSLVDRLSDPDPERRFQNADEVLAFLDAEPPERDDLDALLDAYPAADAPAEASKPPPATTARPAKARGGSSMPLVLVGVVAIGGLVGAAWFLGLPPFAPGIPVVDQYTLDIRQPEGGVPTAEGYVPSEEILATLDSRLSDAGGSGALSVASGNIADGWGPAVLALLGQVEPLDEWQISLDGNTVSITGLANDRAVRDATQAAFEQNGLPEGLSGNVDIALGPRLLGMDVLSPVLSGHADCGPLAVLDPPEGGFPTGSAVTVQGRLASTQTRVSLFEALEQSAGDRPVVIDTEVLNPALCLIESSLPSAPPGGIDIEMGFGDRPDPNPSGRYFVGENPVIDVVLPVDVTDGYLWVSALDVSGNVFHLLPNLNRTDNTVEGLRDGADGALPIRVAYGMEEAQADGKLAFLVDDSTLGKSKIVVLLSDTPLFDEMRPTTESASGYAEALAALANDGESEIRSLDSRILTTVEN